jgi:lipopolysaccharide transport system ATP-binding protein
MSDLALRVERLGKRYRLGQRTGYRTLRETVSAGMRGLLRRTTPGPTNEEFWALRDASFEVQRGDVVGVIGRNGAGKSTLLKILTRITEPTEGEADIYGRVGSLLEVGTGFNPELTGRENVFLNGAILGMGRAEMRRKFDEIAAFAEVEPFLDTPVKRYSSGMSVRLAFAVAAHLEPDVLLVDEVLAVGDINFQKKCLQKMESVGSQGRTVLFVSHNMQAVARLCSRALLLEGGRVVTAGPTLEVTRAYLRAGGSHGTAEREWLDPPSQPGNHIVRLRAVRVRPAGGDIGEALDIRAAIDLELDYEVLQGGQILIPAFHLYNEDGVCLFAVNDNGSAWGRRPRPVGRYRSTVHLPGNFLAEGLLTVGAGVVTLTPPHVHAYEADVVAFQVFDRLEGGSARGDYTGPYPGVMRPVLPWTTEEGVS